MNDVVYQVTTSYLCAAYVVREGRVVDCAPILRKRLSYWMTVAKRVEPPQFPAVFALSNHQLEFQ